MSLGNLLRLVCYYVWKRHTTTHAIITISDKQTLRKLGVRGFNVSMFVYVSFLCLVVGGLGCCFVTYALSRFMLFVCRLCLQTTQNPKETTTQRE